MVAEAIISTYMPDGSPNAAPMGVIQKDRESVLIKPYVETQTYRNLCSRRCAVVNITDDVELFYRTAFKEVNPGGSLPLKWFERAKLVDAPRLKMADAFVEVGVEQVKVSGPRAEVTCRVELIDVSNLAIKPYCRARFAAIESIVHATRVKELLRRGESSEADVLLKLIEHYSSLINRVHPRSSYAEVVSSLLKLLREQRRKL